MKPLTILEDERKLELNNSGTILLAKYIPLSEIKLQKEFQELFPLIQTNIERICKSIKENGFDKSQPLHIWNNSGKNILIDGHHRRLGAIEAGLFDVPCFIHEFSCIEKALEYALLLQTERRNLNDADLLKALKVVDELKLRGPSMGNEKGKSAEKTAELLGISRSRVEKTRTVDKYATEEMKAKILTNELTMNKAYDMIRQRIIKQKKSFTLAEKIKRKSISELAAFLHGVQKRSIKTIIEWEDDLKQKELFQEEVKSEKE